MLLKKAQKVSNQRDALQREGIVGLDISKYCIDFNNIVTRFISSEKHSSDLQAAIELLKSTKSNNKRIFLIGNGGSAAIAEHMAVDLTKNAGLQALTISGSPMLTTFSNDYGYDKVFQKGVEHFANEGDILIAISSGGTSINILNACDAARRKKMKVITFSGFDSDNPLMEKGDLNFWVDSRAFGYVELIHNLLIHYINDAIIGSVEYMIR